MFVYDNKVFVACCGVTEIREVLKVSKRIIAVKFVGDFNIDGSPKCQYTKLKNYRLVDKDEFEKLNMEYYDKLVNREKVAMQPSLDRVADFQKRIEIIEKMRQEFLDKLRS